MTPGQQLKAIEKLTLDDGLSYRDLRRIELWCELAGPDYDFTVFGESTQAKISLIHYRYFYHVAGTEDEYKRRMK